MAYPNLIALIKENFMTPCDCDDNTVNSLAEELYSELAGARYSYSQLQIGDYPFGPIYEQLPRFMMFPKCLDPGASGILDGTISQLQDMNMAPQVLEAFIADGGTVYP